MNVRLSPLTRAGAIPLARRLDRLRLLAAMAIALGLIIYLSQLAHAAPGSASSSAVTAPGWLDIGLGAARDVIGVAAVAALAWVGLHVKSAVIRTAIENALPRAAQAAISEIETNGVSWVSELVKHNAKVDTAVRYMRGHYPAFLAALGMTDDTLREMVSATIKLVERRTGIAGSPAYTSVQPGGLHVGTAGTVIVGGTAGDAQVASPSPAVPAADPAAPAPSGDPSSRKVPVATAPGPLEAANPA